MASMSNGFRFLLLPLWCLVAFPGWIASAAAQESPSAKSDEGILSLTFENDLDIVPTHRIVLIVVITLCKINRYQVTHIKLLSGAVLEL